MHVLHSVLLCPAASYNISSSLIYNKPQHTTPHHTRFLMAVSRHGINRGESGPMLRASFEETVEVFMNAAVFSQYDVLNGVTENVMLGQLGKLGTGMVDLLVDTSKLINAVDFSEIDQDRDVDQDSRTRNMFESHTPFATPYMATSPGYHLDGMSGQTPIAGSFTPTGGQSPYMNPMYSPG
jgi:DNA-directed RNA polymerase II subunit RPB1